MSEPHRKADLLRYLQDARDALLWKMDGLGEYDVRRPLTPTGTNLLGLVRHVTGIELGYLGDTFGRPYFDPAPPPAWYRETAEPNADMWVGPDEPRERITGLYRLAWEHANTTITTLPLDTIGRVPWWPETRQQVTLHHIVVRVIADTHRHAGHADIARELIDGAAGWSRDHDNLPSTDPAWWADYRHRLEQSARQADHG